MYVLNIKNYYQIICIYFWRGISSTCNVTVTQYDKKNYKIEFVSVYEPCKITRNIITAKFAAMKKWPIEMAKYPIPTTLYTILTRFEYKISISILPRAC